MLKRKEKEKKKKKKEEEEERDRDKERERESFMKVAQPSTAYLVEGERWGRGSGGGWGGEEGCSKTLQSIINCEFQRQLKKLFIGVGAIPAITSLMC